MLQPMSAVFESLPAYDGTCMAGQQDLRVLEDPTMPVGCRSNGRLARCYLETLSLAVTRPGSLVTLRARTIGQEVATDRSIRVVPRHINQLCRPESLMFLVEKSGIHLVAEQSRVSSTTEPNIVSITRRSECGSDEQEVVEWAEDTILGVGEHLVARIPLDRESTKDLLDPVDVEFRF